MTIAIGDKIPSVNLINQIGEGEVNQIDIAARIAGKRAVIFGLPGAYTGVCSSAHLPSFIRTADAFRAKGIEEIICFAVNDVRVMNHWGENSGAHDAGVLMLADWDSELTKALGLDFSFHPLGFKDRTNRCAMLVEDGVVKVLQVEENNGVCDLTAGETLLEMV